MFSNFDTFVFLQYCNSECTGVSFRKIPRKKVNIFIFEEIIFMTMNNILEMYHCFKGT